MASELCFIGLSICYVDKFRRFYSYYAQFNFTLCQQTSSRASHNVNWFARVVPLNRYAVVNILNSAIHDNGWIDLD